MKRDFSPRSLAILAIAGAGLAGSTWFLSFVPIPKLLPVGCGFGAMLWADRLRIAAFLLPFALGIAISIKAEMRFNSGFRNFQWTEAEMASTKSLVTQPYWAWSAFLLLFVAILSMVVDRHVRNGSMIYMLILPAQTATRLRQLIAPVTPPNSALVDLHNLQPIQSEHWGESRSSS